MTNCRNTINDALSLEYKQARGTHAGHVLMSDVVQGRGLRPTPAAGTPCGRVGSDVVRLDSRNNQDQEFKVKSKVMKSGSGLPRLCLRAFARPRRTLQANAAVHSAPCNRQGHSTTLHCITHVTCALTALQ